MDERPAANRANGTNGAAWTLRLASTMSSAGGAMRALLQARAGRPRPSARLQPQTAAAILAVRPDARNIAGSALVDATGTTVVA